MYFKGCENSTTQDSQEARKAFRDGWNRIFWNKADVGTVKFPSGKGYYSDKDGRWYDSEEYRKLNNVEHKPTVMLTKDNVFYSVEDVVRTDQKTGRQYTVKEYVKSVGLEVKKSTRQGGTQVRHEFKKVAF